MKPKPSAPLDGLEMWFLEQSLLLRNSKTKVEYAAADLEAEELNRLLLDLLRVEDETAAYASLGCLEALNLIVKPTGNRLSLFLRSLAAEQFFLLRTSVRHWDYSDESAIRKDAEDMLEYERSSPRKLSTQLIHSGEFGNDLNLPRSVLYLSELVNSALRTQYSGRFHHEVIKRKLFPSIGARHGIICHLAFFDISCERYRLVNFIDRDVPTIVAGLASNCFAKPASIFLILSCHYDSYQWRYRNGWIYQCIFLDLGHLLSSLKLSLKNSGFEITIAHPSQELVGVMEELVNEPLAVVECKMKTENLKEHCQ